MLATLAPVAISAVVHAQGPAPLAFSWEAPDECPSRDAVLTSIAKHLERTRSAELSPDPTDDAQARITRKAGRYRLALTIHVRQAKMQRELIAGNCEALGEAAAFLIALAIEPEAVKPSESVPLTEEVSRSPAAGEATTEAPDAAPVQSVGGAEGEVARAHAHENEHVDAHAHANANEHVDDERDDAGPVAMSLGLGAGLGMDAGTLPGAPRFGFRAQLGLGVAGVRALAGLSLWPTARVEASGYPTATLKSGAWLSDVMLGYELDLASVLVTPCIVVEYGEVALQTRGIATPASRTAARFGAGAGLRAEYRLVLGLRGLLEVVAVAPFSRPRWLVDTTSGDVAVFTTAPLAMRVSVGLAYVFE